MRQHHASIMCRAPLGQVDRVEGAQPGPSVATESASWGDRSSRGGTPRSSGVCQNSSGRALIRGLLLGRCQRWGDAFDLSLPRGTGGGGIHERAAEYVHEKLESLL